jgi:tetratricopeptide (TPR) repeat protein
MSERVDARLVLVQAMLTLGACLIQSGRFAEGLESTERAFVLAKELRDFGALMRAYVNLSSNLAEATSDLRRAEALLREGLEVTERAGAAAGWLVGNLADVLFDLGRLSEAEMQQRRALELSIREGDEPLRGMRLAQFAMLLLTQGRLEEGEVMLAESVPILEANPEPQSHVFIPLCRGTLALIRGENGEAAERFAEAVELLREFTVDASGASYPNVVRALQRAGRADEANSFGDLSAHSDSPAARANAKVVGGLLALDPNVARRLLSEGVSELDALGMRVHVARALVDLARAEARAGDDPRGTLDRARELTLECGARGFLFEVDDAMAELGA